jgi:protein TonB
MEQPTPPKQKSPVPVVRTKPAALKKPAPSVKPTKKARPQRPQETAKPVAQTTSVNTNMPELSTTAEARPVNVVSPPKFHADFLHNPRPRYPLMSRKRHEEGEVLLRVRVDAQGRPESVELHTSSGHKRLDIAASSAVQEWRFVPARQGGLNVAAWVVVPIQFNLEK